MLRKIVTVLLMVAVSSLVFLTVTGEKSYDEWVREQSKLIAQQEQQEREEFNRFVEDDAAAFARYQEEVAKKWREFVNSTREEWVAYSKDLDGMSRVNFKDGVIVIEALIETHSEGDMNEARRKVSAQVEQLLSEDNVTGTKILNGQLLTPGGTPVTEENQSEYIQELVRKTKKTIGHFKGRDGVDRMRVRLEIPMAPDHIRTRAETYLPWVMQYGRMFKVDVALLLAIMETESTFNPLAKSPVPAYGLMQIVPRYAGLEVNQRFFNNDEPPQPSQLYQPEQNIQFGAAYFNAMRNQQFRRVTDDEKALYLLVSAYNTGPSNVAWALTGERYVNQAVDVANEMTADSLFTKLVENLPSQETRDYLRRVTGRIPHYIEWREGNRGED